MDAMGFYLQWLKKLAREMGTIGVLIKAPVTRHINVWGRGRKRWHGT
jgi:hypothetical protein